MSAPSSLRRIHVFGHGSGAVLANRVSSSRLPTSPTAAADAFDAVLADTQIEAVLFWDGDLPPDIWLTVARFQQSLDDVWLASATIDSPDALDLLRYVMPIWVYRQSPDVAWSNHIGWKLSLQRALISTRVLRAVGGISRDYETLDGAALDLGLRLIRNGAVCRQRSELGTFSRSPVALADRYRLIKRFYGAKWLGYTLARRIGERRALLPEVRAFRDARNSQMETSSTNREALNRDVSNVQLPKNPTVSIVLPTFGRYRYVAEVLDDIRAQTVRPTQILIADGNPPGERQPEVYDRYRDLPIEVLWHEQEGTCSGRNACLAKATGEFVWFVDDDSRFGPDNLEAHLRVLAGYGADVSVGPAYTKSRPALYAEQRAIVSTFMDCGTTVCRRQLVEQVGGFDMQFNFWLVNEDGEIGLRFLRAGALMVNNPFAKRFHYYAPVGGSRSPQSVHKFTRWSLLPRPAQSFYYFAKRYFEPGTEVDAVLQAAVLYGWRRKEGQAATRTWRLKTLVGELIAAPLTAWRLAKSVRLGREMLREGPRIPSFTFEKQTRADVS